jgi:hypothetical protein
LFFLLSSFSFSISLNNISSGSIDLLSSSSSLFSSVLLFLLFDDIDVVKLIVE